MSPQGDINFEKELWETAVSLRGTVSPADYKHCYKKWGADKIDPKDKRL